MIEAANREHIRPDDVCLYYHIHTTRANGEQYTEANSLIANYKKDPRLLAERPDLVIYKEQAITRCAELLRTLVDGLTRRVNEAVLVPMPTSEPRGTEWRDDRLDRTCKLILEHTEHLRFMPYLDVLMTLQKAHAGGPRNPALIRSNLVWKSEEDVPSDCLVILFDDVLTTGAHFRACKDFVLERSPSCEVMGAFIAIHDWGGRLSAVRRSHKEE